MDDYHLELWLRHVASNIALGLNVPRYRVATDSLCRFLARVRPRTVEGVLAAFGVMKENRQALPDLLNAIPR